MAAPVGGMIVAVYPEMVTPVISGTGIHLVVIDVAVPVAGDWATRLVEINNSKNNFFI